MKIFIVFLPAPPTSRGRWLPLPEPDSVESVVCFLDSNMAERPEEDSENVV